MEIGFIRLPGIRNIESAIRGWYGDTYASTGEDRLISQPHGKHVCGSIYKVSYETVTIRGWYGNTYASTGEDKLISQPHGKQCMYLRYRVDSYL